MGDRGEGDAPGEVWVVAFDEVAEALGCGFDDSDAFEGFAGALEAFFAFGGGGCYGWAEAVDRG